MNSKAFVIKIKWILEFHYYTFFMLHKTHCEKDFLLTQKACKDGSIFMFSCFNDSFNKEKKCNELWIVFNGKNIFWNVKFFSHTHHSFFQQRSVMSIIGLFMTFNPIFRKWTCRLHSIHFAQVPVKNIFRLMLVNIFDICSENSE